MTTKNVAWLRSEECHELLAELYMRLLRHLHKRIANDPTPGELTAAVHFLRTSGLKVPNSIDAPKINANFEQLIARFSPNPSFIEA